MMIAWQLYIFWFFSISDCKKFKDTVEEIAEEQGKTEVKENEEVSIAAADLVQKLTVTEASKEGDAEEEEAPASDHKKDAKG
jgi:Ran-binding protein 1